MKAAVGCRQTLFALAQLALQSGPLQVHAICAALCTASNKAGRRAASNEAGRRAHRRLPSPCVCVGTPCALCGGSSPGRAALPRAAMQGSQPARFKRLAKDGGHSRDHADVVLMEGLLDARECPLRLDPWR